MTSPRISVYLDKHYYSFDAYDVRGYAGRRKKIKRVRRGTNPVVYTGVYEELDNKPIR